MGKTSIEWCDQSWRWVTQKDRKGGDMSEWSEELRVREFPQ